MSSEPLNNRHCGDVLCNGRFFLACGGCGPVVRLLACQARAQRSIACLLERKWRLQTNVALLWWTWNKLHLGYCSDMARWYELQLSHSDSTWPWSCVEVLGKPLISRCLCPPSSEWYLMERESWVVMIGCICSEVRKCWILPRGDETTKEYVPVSGV